jgi:polar amino acid transport system substrate-binding protein
MKTIFAILIIGITITLDVYPARVAAEDNGPTVVVESQERLKALGYDPGPIDGVFGLNTEKAIQAFQRDSDLPITGQLDTETKKYLSWPKLVLNTQDFAPFHYKSYADGKVDGPVPDVIKAVCDRAELNCILQLYEVWGDAQKDVKDGKADGLFVIGWNAERNEWLHRSDSIIKTGYGFFVRGDDPLDYQQLADIADYTVGVYGPSNTSDTLKTIQLSLRNKGMDIRIVEKKDDKPLFLELSESEGKMAVFSNKDVGRTIINGLGLSNLRFSGAYKEILYYVGFSRERVTPAIVERFDSAFQDLKKEGIVQQIYANSGLSIDAEIPVPAEPPAPPIPEKSKPQERFVADGLVVSDRTTCLMWQQSGSDDEIDWEKAKDYVNDLNQSKFADYSDWRLPTVDELANLLKPDIQKENRMYISPIFDASQMALWSADIQEDDVEYVDFYDHGTASKSKGDTNFVRAVRGNPCN